MGELRNQAGTPQALFDLLHAEYAFDVDVCAVEHNHKLPDYFTPEDDSLALDWSGLRVWCNPPYDNITPWLEHSTQPIFVAYFLPVRADRFWWQRWKPLAEVHYFVGEKPHKRIQFVAPPGIEYSSNSASNVLLLFGEGATPGLEVWRSGLTGERL